MNFWSQLDGGLFSPNEKQNAIDTFFDVVEVDFNFKMCNKPKAVRKKNRTKVNSYFGSIL